MQKSRSDFNRQCFDWYLEEEEVRKEDEGGEREVVFGYLWYAINVFLSSISITRPTEGEEKKKNEQISFRQQEARRDGRYKGEKRRGEKKRERQDEGRNIHSCNTLFHFF